MVNFLSNISTVIKLALAAVSATVLAAGVWWLIDTVQDNERLTINNSTLEQARLADAEQIKFLKHDSAVKMVIAQKRTEQITSLNKKLLQAKRDVRVITKTVVTEVERECLVSRVPDPIIDFMLDQRPPDHAAEGS